LSLLKTLAKHLRRILVAILKRNLRNYYYCCGDP